MAKHLQTWFFAVHDLLRSPLRPLWALQRGVLHYAGALGLRLRSLLLALGRRTGPAELSLYEDAFAHLTSQTLYALVGCGAFEQLAARGPTTAQQLAAWCLTDAAILARLLRFGVTRGWLRQLRDGRFALARGGRPLVETARRSMAPFVRYAVSPATVRTGEELTRVLKTGGSGFFHAHGQSVWSYFARPDHAQEGRDFDLAMRTHSARDVHHVARAIDPNGLVHVCDLGGGIGTLLASVLQHHPQARGTLLDRAGTLQDAATYLKACGVLARTTLVPGDFFAPIAVRADTFLLRNVLHDWGDEQVLQLLGRVRAAMRPSDRLYIVETLEAAAPTRVTALSDVAMMLVSDNGMQRSRDRWSELLQQARLRLVRTQLLPQPMELLCCAADGDG